jgi:hypothetical protein
MGQVDRGLLAAFQKEHGRSPLASLELTVPRQQARVAAEKQFLESLRAEGYNDGQLQAVITLLRIGESFPPPS